MGRSEISGCIHFDEGHVIETRISAPTLAYRQFLDRGRQKVRLLCQSAAAIPIGAGPDLWRRPQFVAGVASKMW